MKQFQVIWSKYAELDLELIIEYIKIGSLHTAKKIFDEIRNKCDQLHTLPQRKRIVPEFQQIGITKYKELIYKRWRIVYKIDDAKVHILLVADANRNLEDILFQRLIKSNDKEEN
jgi:plasmid stabilization system protein ParE